MFELFITCAVGALVGGTILSVWISRGLWSHARAKETR
jgi:hypothetical protein